MKKLLILIYVFFEWNLVLFIFNYYQLLLEAKSKLIKFGIKVGFSPSKKNCVICFIESPLKMVKNAFYLILKALFVLMIFKFLLRLFGHVGKTT